DGEIVLHVRRLVFSWLALCLLAGVADADEAELTHLPLEFRADTMLVSFDYAPFLTAEDTDALDQGEDLVLSVRLELWQKRRFWFDRLRQDLARHFLLHYDRWEQGYTLTQRGANDWLEPLRVARFSELLDTLRSNYPLSISLESEDFQRRSYLVYSVEVRYVTPEKLDEIAGWLVGSGAQGSKSLPGKALGFLVNSTGIKNRSYLQSSADFLPADRPEQAIFPR
ncbi:MAG: DUF4390 domain-containing protein, partial [bacterium]